jgi:hypothetical protein
LLEKYQLHVMKDCNKKYLGYNNIPFRSSLGREKISNNFIMISVISASSDTFIKKY